MANRVATRPCAGNRIVRLDPTWLNRSVLMLRLRSKMEISRFRRAYVRLYAGECSERELRDVAHIDASEVAHLGQAMREHLGAQRRVPRITVLCLGADVDEADLPASIRGTRDFGRGVWLREARTAVAMLGDNVPVRRIVIHEMVHALMDVLTNGFPYLIALQEGLARSAEYGLRDVAGNREWDKVRSTRARRGCPQFINDENCMSIMEMLSFNVAECRRRNANADYSRMVNLSFWLHAFLLKLSAQRPVLKRMLADLRRHDVRTPDGVYIWLQDAVGLDERQLEESFYAFCTAGTLPDLPAGECSVPF